MNDVLPGSDAPDFVLDTKYPYYAPPPHLGFNSRLPIDDSPASSLPDWATRAEASDTLKMYLMFLPPPPTGNDSKVGSCQRN